MSTQPWQLSALELARRITARDWSCAEVVDAHLARIHALAAAQRHRPPAGG